MATGGLKLPRKGMFIVEKRIVDVKRKSLKGKPIIQKNSKKTGIGFRIEQLRIEKGLTLKKMAAVMSESTATVGRWEKTNAVSLEDVIKLTKYFGVSCDYLIVGEEGAHLDHTSEIGLSESAVRLFKSDKSYLQIVNSLCESEYGIKLLDACCSMMKVCEDCLGKA